MVLKELYIKMIADASGVKKGTDEAGREIDKLQDKANGLGNAFQKVAGIIGNIFQKAVLTVTASLTAAVVEGTRFEDNIVRAFHDAADGASITSQAFQKFSGIARETGKTTIFSAVQAATALRTLASANLNTNESMKALSASTSLAASTGIDLTASAYSIGQVLKIFARSGIDAATAAGYLATGAIKGSLNVEAFTSSLRLLGPTAALAGWNLKELVSGVTTLSDYGIEGMRATMGLATTMRQLMDPSSQLSKLLTTWGVSTLDTSGKLKSLSTILGDVSKAVGEDTNKIRQLTDMGGPAFTTLATSAKTSFDSISREMDNSKSMMKKLANEYQKTLPGSFLRLKAVGVEALLTLFTAVEEPLVKIVNSLSEWILKTSEVITKNKTLQKIMEGLQKVLEPIGKMVLDLGDKFVKWLGTLKPGDIEEFFNKIIKFCNDAVSAVTKLVDAINSLFTAFQNLKTGLTSNIFGGIFQAAFPSMPLAGKMGEAVGAKLTTKEQKGESTPPQTTSKIGVTAPEIGKAVSGNLLMPGMYEKKWQDETEKLVQYFKQSTFAAGASYKGVINVFDEFFKVNVSNEEQLRAQLKDRFDMYKKRMEQIQGADSLKY